MIKQKLFDLYCGFQRAFNLEWLPPLIIWDVTYRCNQRCGFCPYYGKGGRVPNLNKEMSFDDVTKMVLNITKSYLGGLYRPHIHLTGGEPLVRTDFEKIALLLNRYLLNYSITTNGLLLEKYIDVLKETECSNVVLSVHDLYGRHDAITRVKGSFGKVVKNIKLLKKAGIDCEVNCVITDSNVSHLSYIKNFFDKLKVPIRFQHLEWLTEQTEKVQDVFSKKVFRKSLPMKFGTTRLSAEKVSELYFSFLKEESPSQEPRKLDINTVHQYYLSLVPFRSRCVNIYGNVRINPCGDVYPCVDYYYGNIKKESFGKIWKGKRARFFRKTMKDCLMPGCPRCCKL